MILPGRVRQVVKVDYYMSNADPETASEELAGGQKRTSY